jgi:hypothetical protein
VASRTALLKYGLAGLDIASLAGSRGWRSSRRNRGPWLTLKEDEQHGADDGDRHDSYRGDDCSISGRDWPLVPRLITVFAHCPTPISFEMS